MRSVGGSGLPERPVLVTFDDGFADFRSEAWPALREAGFVATLYVTTGFLEGLHRASGATRPPGPWLDWDALPGLSEQGVEIGGHSHTHPHLDTLSAEAARRRDRRLQGGSRATPAGAGALLCLPARLPQPFRA